MKHILGDGKRIRFWHEVWLDEFTLRIKYGKLFNICNQQDWEVAKVLEGGQINLTFRRNFDAPEWEGWFEMESELADIELTIEKGGFSKMGSNSSWSIHCAFSLCTLVFPWS
jgi:hypothetical protein